MAPSPMRRQAGGASHVLVHNAGQNSAAVIVALPEK